MSRLFRLIVLVCALGLVMPAVAHDSHAPAAATTTPTTYPTLAQQGKTGKAMVDNVSFTTAARNTIYSCQFSSGTAGFGFSWVSSNWVITYANKVMVEGSNAWTSFTKLQQTADGYTQWGSNGLPNHWTGTYPTASSTTAGQQQYHPDPSSIGTSRIYIQIPTNPVYSNTPRCIGGAVGILFTGSALFNALDADGRDAVANEIFDQCEGHPETTQTYHYHHLTNCYTDSTSGHSVQFGYALDGFGIYGPKGESGQVLTNADLDVCHGHSHSITDVNGVTKTEYHYHGNEEFPYTVGCFRGTTQVNPTTYTALTTPSTGFWYVSGTGGRGYGVEVQGSQLFFGIYTYDSSGADIWYVGSCMLGQTTCTGSLAAYQNGTTLANLGVAATTPVATTSPGTFSLTVSSSSAMTITVTPTTGSAATFTLSRYPISGSTVSSAPSWAPEAGWWYSPSYAGTGWFVESQGTGSSAGVTYSNFFVVGYSYGSTGASGQANWYAGSGQLANNTTSSSWTGSLYEYQNGPTLTGAGGTLSTYANRGSATIQFTSSTTATVTLPNGQRLAIQRYNF